MQIALIADVHGNRWALEAVLEDIERRRCDLILNLGDCLFGPLDPAGTAALLMNLDAPSVRGNQDRALTTPPAEIGANPTLEFVLGELTDDQIAWFGWLEPTRIHGDVFLCHGTPDSDEAYLLEDASSGRAALREGSAIAGDVRAVAGPIIACGHSHVQRTARLDAARMCINPGSVGLPAYSVDGDAPHVMESGTPHARYAVLKRRDDGWDIDLIALHYEWEWAATTAAKNGRADWADWIRTGRAQNAERRMENAE